MEKMRSLGHSGMIVSAIGMGCWAIGGDSYGNVDDAQSIQAIHCALEMGVNFFDTANVYGNGHSERVLGQALKSRRDKAVIATKFGYVNEEDSKSITGESTSRENIIKACDASLTRLDTDYIDLYQLHIGALSGAAVDEVIGALDELLAAGKIRAYGWSTDTFENALRFAKLPHCAAIQYQLNLFYENAKITDICEKYGVAGLIRGPLAMGALTGKYNHGLQLSKEDVRGKNIVWVPYFQDGVMTGDFANKLEAAREILTSDGRTLAQGALSWLLTKSNCAIPIPGCKTVAQVRENFGTLGLRRFSPEQMDALEQLIPPLPWSQM